MRRYDLNLLFALDALLAERSVSGAARRMGIGQPAMSAALARLRDLLDDPILVRARGGMQPTPRAIELADPLRNALAKLNEIIEPSAGFDPRRSDRVFRLSGGDYVGMMIMPGLARRLAEDAPNVSVRFRYLEKSTALKALEEDVLDLALLVMPDLPARFEDEVVIEETFTGAARRDHPAISGTLDASTFASLNHLLVTESGDTTGCVDEALSAVGLSRRVAMTVPGASLVADILRVSDMVATVPRRAALRMAASGDIALFDPPVETPRWAVRTIWAKRNSRDPALAWLRAQLVDIAAELDEPHLAGERIHAPRNSAVADRAPVPRTGSTVY